jgi:protein PhnA
MSALPNCPQCSSEFTYEDGDNYVCPECAHEWPKLAAVSTDEARVIRDSKIEGIGAMSLKSEFVKKV